VELTDTAGAEFPASIEANLTLGRVYSRRFARGSSSLSQHKMSLKDELVSNAR